MAAPSLITHQASRTPDQTSLHALLIPTRAQAVCERDSSVLQSQHFMHNSGIACTCMPAVEDSTTGGSFVHSHSISTRSGYFWLSCSRPSAICIHTDSSLGRVEQLPHRWCIRLQLSTLNQLRQTHSHCVGQQPPLAMKSPIMNTPPRLSTLSAAPHTQL